MLGKLSRFASPEVERLLKDLQADEDNYNQELRTLQRDKIVFPVNLTSPEGDFESYAFARDVSSEGVGLITQFPVYQATQMYLKLNVPNHPTKYLAECRWNRKFGDTFWTSGWLLNEDRFDVELIRQSDATVEWDVRSTEREKFAVPVVIHQKGTQPKIQAFTRNLSGDGVNLVSQQEVQVSSFCKLQFVRIGGERFDVIGKCVWTHKYGEDYWLTGWQFPRLDRIAKFHAACFE
jgi:hypothetical protein